MKKRILAAVLAAATAFSMFGASLSASAAIDKDGKYESYTAIAADTADDKFSTYTSAFAAGNEKTELEALAALLETVNTEANPTIESGVVYIVDYKYTSDERTALVAALNDMYAKIEAVKDATNVTSDEATALNNAATALNTAYTAIVNASDAQDDAVLAQDAATRLNAYNRVIAAAKVMKNVTDGMFATGDYAYYNIAGLKSDLAGVATGAGNYTSKLIDLADSYDALNDLFGFADLVDENALMAYEAKLEEVSLLVPDDYTTYNWAKVEAYINVADAYAAEGKYVEALAELNKIAGVSVKAADKTDLRAALKALFTNTVTIFPNTYPEASNAKYPAKEFEDKVGVTVGKTTYKYTEAYVEFAIGVPSIDKSGNDYLAESYYAKAVRIYKQANVAQSIVDNALAELENAVAALEITNLASEWEIVKLENYLDTATSKFKEGDYRNNANWKKLVAAIEDAESILAKSYPGKTEVKNVTDLLEDFIDGTITLSPVSYSSARAELRSLIREAKAMLKDTTDKPAAVILGLEKAVATAENVYTNGKLLSTFEDAVASLTSAMDDYTNGIVPDVVNGWYYSDADKAWYFYKEDGTEMTGWMWDASYNGWYYFREDGTMVEDCSKMIGSTWYYFYKGGKMAASAWAKGLDGKWYYYNASGAMATSSWILSSGKYYYVGSDGAMLVNTTTPDGYKVDANGVWVQ